jgi:hypothetical protein
MVEKADLEGLSMNDGVRRSLLVAQVAKLQAEDEAELAGDVLLAVDWGARPGWGSSGAATSDWAGEQPARMVAVMDTAMQGGWTGMDGSLRGKPSEA